MFGAELFALAVAFVARLVHVPIASEDPIFVGALAVGLLGSGLVSYRIRRDRWTCIEP